MKYISPFIIFAIIIVIFYKGLSLHPNVVPSPMINQAAPHFSLPNLANPKQLITQKDLLGKVTLLNVWATWCSACEEEHIGLLYLAKKEGVIFWGLDYKDDTSAAKQWLQQRGNPYQLVLEDKDGSAAIDWGVYGTPETFLIDKKGIIRYKYSGPITKEVWEQEIKPLLLRLRNELA